MAELPKSRIFFWVLVSFVAGIAFRSFLKVPIEVIWAFFVFAILAAGFSILRPDSRWRFALCALLALAFSAGMFRHFQKAEVVSRALDPFLGRQVMFRGIVDDEPARKAKSQVAVLKTPGSPGQKVLVITRPYPEFDYGDELEASGLLEEPENFSDDFDYKAYLAKDDIYYLMRFPEIERLGIGKGNFIYHSLFSLKRAFGERMQNVLPEPEAAFIGGLILGERRAIPQYITDEFVLTGTSHIVALSGYNITIIAASLMRFLGILSLPIALTVWLSGFGIILFTLLTGASASVVRASVMGLLVLLARQEGRVYHMRNALVFAGAAMIFQNPAVLRFDTSFQLSFLATMGLIYAAPIFDGWLEKGKNRVKIFFRNHNIAREDREHFKKHKKSFLREIFISTLAAQFFVLPLLIYDFGRLSIISPLANISILPFIPLTMFLGFIAGAFGFLSESLAHIFGWAAWLAAHYELAAISFFSRFPFAALELGRWSIIPLTLVYAWIFWKLKKRNNVAKN